MEKGFNCVGTSVVHHGNPFARVGGVATDVVNNPGYG